MIRYTLVPIAAAALLACAKGEQASQSEDATARNLALAPTESTAALRDVPPPPAPSPTPRPAPRTRTPQPVSPAPARSTTPASSATLTAGAGTRVSLAASDTITTRHVKAGDPFTATVSQDVRDAAGRVVIPAGSTVQGAIVAAEPAPNPSSSGKLELAVTSVSVRGTSYPVEATVEGKDTVMQGRGVTGADAAKVGVGAAAGALAGRLLGKNTKGAVVGGAVGAAAGAAAARVSRDIDVVLPKGAAITIKLAKSLTVKRM